jgi:hypothetical protein
MKDHMAPLKGILHKPHRYIVRLKTENHDKSIKYTVF